MSIESDMMYKLDFLARFFTGMLWVALETLLIYLIYDVSGVSKIVGYSRAEILLVYAIYQMVMAVVYIITPGMVIKAIFQQIHTGGLDFFIIKPLNVFWNVAFQKITLREFSSSFVYAVLMIGYLLANGELYLDGWGWMTVGLIVVFSIVLISVIYWIAIFIAFFVERAGFAINFADNVSGFGIYPRKLYPHWVQVVLLNIFPFFLIANPVYDLLDGSFGWQKAGQMLLMLVLFVLILAVEWRGGLRKYNSAA